MQQLSSEEVVIREKITGGSMMDVSGPSLTSLRSSLRRGCAQKPGVTTLDSREIRWASLDRL